MNICQNPLWTGDDISDMICIAYLRKINTKPTQFQQFIEECFHKSCQQIKHKNENNNNQTIQSKPRSLLVEDDSEDDEEEEEDADHDILMMKQHNTDDDKNIKVC
jgi:hypothetical protein